MQIVCSVEERVLWVVLYFVSIIRAMFSTTDPRNCKVVIFYWTTYWGRL